MQQTLQWILTAEELPELLDDQREVDAFVAARPDLSKLTNAQLLAHGRARMDLFRPLFAQHIFITNAATVPVGMLQQICGELGEPDAPMRLAAGIGGVDSAAPSWAMWDIARQVAESPALTAAFDAGVAGLLERLRADPDAAKFVLSIDDFIEQYGSRGPNEWEMSAPTWGTNPELALAAIDRMRQVDATGGPQPQWDERGIGSRGTHRGAEQPTRTTRLTPKGSFWPRSGPPDCSSPAASVRRPRSSS